MPDPNMSAPPVLSPNNDDLIADSYEAPTSYYDDAQAEYADKIVGQFKKGWKTSELHTTLFTFGVVIANAVFDLDFDGEELGTLVAANVGYVLSRTGVKFGRLRTLARPW